MNWKPPHVPLVGPSTRLLWLCHVLLDRHTRPVLQERALSAFLHFIVTVLTAPHRH